MGRYALGPRRQPRHDSLASSTDRARPTPGGPDSEGCFSGSAVVFEGKPAFIYTGVQNAPPDQATIRDGSDKLRETQLLAIAEDDKLLHWKKRRSRSSQLRLQG